MFSCDLESPEFYSETRHCSRKARQCCETGRIIQPGEHYWLCRGKWDGEFRSYVQSEAAFHFARYLNLELDSCMPFGQVGEHIGEMFTQRPELEDEWARVCRGEVTRDTMKGEP